MDKFQQLIDTWYKHPYYICHAAALTLNNRQLTTLRIYLNKTRAVEEISGVLEYHIFQAQVTYSTLGSTFDIGVELVRVNFSVEMLFYRIRLLEELRQELFCELKD